MRWARVRIAWDKTRMIFAAVNGGLLAGFVTSLVAPDPFGLVVATLTAFVLLMVALLRRGRPRVMPPMPASAWRFPILFGVGTVMIAGVGVAGMLPASLFDWIAGEVVVLGLTAIVTLNDAFGPDVPAAEG